MNRVQEMEERISNIEDKIEKSDTLLKQNALKKKTTPAQNFQGLCITMKRLNLRIMNRGKRINPVQTHTKCIQQNNAENFPYIKKEVSITEEAYRTPNT